MPEQHPFLEYLDKEAAWAGEQLARDMRQLGTRLVRMADMIDRKGVDAIVNDLGEIQAEGAIVNALCGRFSALRHAARDGRKFESSDQEDATVEHPDAH